MRERWRQMRRRKIPTWIVRRWGVRRLLRIALLQPMPPYLGTELLKVRIPSTLPLDQLHTISKSTGAVLRMSRYNRLKPSEAE